MTNGSILQALTALVLSIAAGVIAWRLWRRNRIVGRTPNTGRAEKAAAMTIDDAGFLSSEMGIWIERHRTDPKSRDWFSLADDLNRLLQKIVLVLGVRSNDNQAFTATLLFLRGVSSFQGVVLLAERGMTNDARTIARSCFETLFYLGAVLKDSAFIDALVRDDADRRGKLARRLLDLPGAGLEEVHRTRLNGFLSDLKASGVEAEAVKVFAAATIAELEQVYDTYYRGLSNDAAHPSVTSLNRHLKANDVGEVSGFHWGPDVEDVEDTMNNACTAAIYLVAFAQQIVTEEAVFERLDLCWDKYKKLVEAKTAPVVGGAAT